MLRFGNTTEHDVRRDVDALCNKVLHAKVVEDTDIDPGETACEMIWV